MATREREEIFDRKAFSVHKINADLFKRLDIVFFSGKEGAGMEWADITLKSGCVVVDNAGDFRMYPNIPLVIPEVNMDAVTKETRHMCNQNCSTIKMAVTLYPLHKAARLRRVIANRSTPVLWSLYAPRKLSKSYPIGSCHPVLSALVKRRNTPWSRSSYAS